MFFYHSYKLKCNKTAISKDYNIHAHNSLITIKKKIFSTKLLIWMLQPVKFIH